MQLWSRKNAVLLTLTMAATHAIAQSSTEQPDKYQWLEDVNGARSMAWVNAENERSAKVLEADPRYAGLAATALKVLESPDRLQDPDFREGEVYNTWQDAQHHPGPPPPTPPTPPTHPPHTNPHTQK